jgi:hypothetical protein
VWYEPNETNVPLEPGVDGARDDDTGEGKGDEKGEALKRWSRGRRLLKLSVRITRWCSCADGGDGGRGEVGDEARAREAGGDSGAGGRSPLSASWLLYGDV